MPHFIGGLLVGAMNFVGSFRLFYYLCYYLRLVIPIFEEPILISFQCKNLHILRTLKSTPLL